MSHDESIPERIQREREQIEQKRAEVLAQLHHLSAEQARLDKQAQDLETAARVVARWFEPPEAASDPPLSSISQPGRRKPDGLPTIPEMVEMVLIAAEKEGISAVGPGDVLKRIRANWWPEAIHTDVSPTMARMANKGKIIRIGHKYTRIKPDSAPTYVNGARE